MIFLTESFGLKTFQILSNEHLFYGVNLPLKFLQCIGKKNIALVAQVLNQKNR